MKLIKCIVLIFITLFSLNYHVNAANIQTSTDNQFYNIMKYEKFENAIDKFEEKNKIKVGTPTQFPFIITHKFGKIHSNGYLDLYYYNQNTKQMLKTIIINNNEEIDQIPTDLVTYVDNLKVFIRQSEVGSKIQFHKKNLTYVIFVSKRTSNFSKDDAINIVKSIK
ncbi:hypothetical protein COJ46_21895 [Bacillus sp. AFS077874]|uniref:hypothetical protein n=1 Tax=unclassified Bacillus (in: firmicutes) TaxID=185979 RepID=UPI000BF36902|nr:MULTISPECIES: hypothetical protein [unclassified Bacillus (in: firmicutes)]PET71579.1 hypothetical protein CN514_06620 [Bacillus sp. AFS001701]PFM75318.1 hypothetical protein COJ46_21895 [Bacillus sp. AFS077874]